MTHAELKQKYALLYQTNDCPEGQVQDGGLTYSMSNETHALLKLIEELFIRLEQLESSPR